VSEFRYAQFCPLARATEVLGERWTLLVVRELLLGPRRFSDLRRHLAGVSPSVLSSRLRDLEERGLVAREELPPPASVSVFELTELGHALRPVVVEMARWGLRLLDVPRPGDQFEPGWLRLGFHSFARRAPTPDRAFALRIPDGAREVVIHVSGGADGTTVHEPGDRDPPEPDAAIRADGLTLLALVSGSLDPAEALASEQIAVSGDVDALRDLPLLFDLADLTGSETSPNAGSPTRE